MADLREIWAASPMTQVDEPRNLAVRAMQGHGRVWTPSVVASFPDQFESWCADTQADPRTGAPAAWRGYLLSDDYLGRLIEAATAGRNFVPQSQLAPDGAAQSCVETQ